MSTGNFKIEDITFRGARRQSEIDSPSNPLVENKNTDVPVSLTYEQVKSYYTKLAEETNDKELKRLYNRTVLWIDELQSLRLEVVKYQLKELKSESLPEDM